MAVSCVLLIPQALNDPDGGWVVIELRHDRAYRSWVTSILQNISNLCVLVGFVVLCRRRVAATIILIENVFHKQAGSVFTIARYHLPDAFFQRIFINHPEPPQQRGTLDDVSSTQ